MPFKGNVRWGTSEKKWACLSLILLIPVKLLDIVFARIRGAELCAAAVYCVVRVSAKKSA